LPLNGSGVYSPPAADFPAVAGTVIESAKFNNVINDMASAISTAIMKDGQSTPTGDIPLATRKITGLGLGTARTDAASLANIQDGSGLYVSVVGGTANAITLTSAPVITAYAAGQTFYFLATAANTGATTVAVSGLAAKNIYSIGGAALTGGEIAIGYAEIVYDGTQFRLIVSGGFAQTETGFAQRVPQDKLRDIKARSDYTSLANFWASSSVKLRYNDQTGQLFGTTDSSPLDYSTTRAGFVWQHRDSASMIAGDQIPGAVFQFTYTGNGVVTAASRLSESIGWGLFAYMRKTGDGSGHCFTGIGEIGAYGPGLYNEGGLFQGTITNTGSINGTISGVEVLLKDSADGGVTDFATQMSGVVSRLAVYNNNVYGQYNFVPSSEGDKAVQAILKPNVAGFAQWQRAFDLTGVTYTTGEIMLSPNNTFLSWFTAGGVNKPLFGMASTDNTIIAAPSAGKSILLTTNTFSTAMQISDDATNRVSIFVGGTLLTVGVGAANSGGAGNRALIVPN
jgi:hypothetical protein